MFRPAVAMICIKDKKILLIHRSGTGKDGWGFPKGGIEKGETPRQALLREMNEELGLIEKDFKTLKETKYVLKYEWNAYLHQQTGYKGQENIIFITELIADHSELDVFAAGELDDYCWCTHSEVLRMLPHDNQREIFEKLIENESIISTDTLQ